MDPPTCRCSCYSCKHGVTQVWLDNDAHGKSASSMRFLSMYNGTDVNGNQCPLTRDGHSRDYGRIPLLPDLSQPHLGPGYRLDFPNTKGNCAACHVPGLAFDRRGFRLGYGGGYHDRLLAQPGRAITLGICYQALLLAEIPREPHDVPVEYLATQTLGLAALPLSP